MEAKVGLTNERCGKNSQNAGQLRRAKNELNALLLQFRGRKSILQLLPVIKRRCSLATLTMAIERLECKKHEFDVEDLVFFEEFKRTLK